MVRGVNFARQYHHRQNANLLVLVDDLMVLDARDDGIEPRVPGLRIRAVRADGHGRCLRERRDGDKRTRRHERRNKLEHGLLPFVNSTSQLRDRNYPTDHKEASAICFGQLRKQITLTPSISCVPDCYVLLSVLVTADGHPQWQQSMQCNDSNILHCCDGQFS